MLAISANKERSLQYVDKSANTHISHFSKPLGKNFFNNVCDYVHLCMGIGR